MYMAKSSRMLLLLATLGLFVLALIMLLKSDSELMAIPLIGATVLAGFGYMMFDSNEPNQPKSAPGAIEYNRVASSEEINKETLPDITRSEYDVPLL